VKVEQGLRTITYKCDACQHEWAITTVNHANEGLFSNRAS
jgi:hypothetical protein